MKHTARWIFQIKPSPAIADVCANVSLKENPIEGEVTHSRDQDYEERLKNQMANEKVRIKVKGYEHSVVDAAAAKIVDAAKRGGARVAGPIPLPTGKQVVTILRAVHKYKDSREQFELRTHKRLIDVIHPTQKTIEALQSLELPAGVEISMDI